MNKREEKLDVSSKDIERLVSHPDRDVRAMLTQKICRQIKHADLSEREQVVVAEILSFIAKDAAAMVRRALAITLKNSRNLPKEVANKLIRDVDSIAVPVLTHSPVLDDEDLTEILRSKAAAKMMAVSKRSYISGNLVKAILRYGDSRVIASTAANDGAEIGASLGSKMLDIYHDNDLIKESFIARKDLPPILVEKLITLVSAEAARRLYETHEIPIDVAVDIAVRSHERASIDFISQSWVSRDINRLVARLGVEGRLTSSLIIRAAACGQMRFCQAALAQKSGVSNNKAALMVHDGGPFGLKALCTRAGLSGRDFTIMRASVVIFRDLEQKGILTNKEKFQSLMLERILSLPVPMSEDDQEYLLERLDNIAA